MTRRTAVFTWAALLLLPFAFLARGAPDLPAADPAARRREAP